MDHARIRAAIAAIPETAWTAIRYPRAIWDDQMRCWISDAEVAEVDYTAFTSKKGGAITARRLIRRRAMLVIFTELVEQAGEEGALGGRVGILRGRQRDPRAGRRGRPRRRGAARRGARRGRSVP